MCKISDPRTGIPGKQKWFPSIAEVRHECELEAAKVANALAQAIRDDARAIGLPPPEVDRAAVMAKIRAQYPEIFDRNRQERETEKFAAVNSLESAAKLAYWRSPMTIGPLLAAYIRRNPVATMALSD